MTVLMAVMFIFGFFSTGQPARADWGVGVSFQGEYSSPSYVYGDRVTSEYRRGYQVDDWVERGESSVTESPLFADGIRLSAWATRYEGDYNYALASAIYYFDIPPQARSVRIKISYEGEADRDDLDNDIAGRVWIRRATEGDEYREYYPEEGRYEDVDKPLFGDTFVLQSKKRLEIIRISADDHVIDGVMELHVVAEGRQRIDVKYIEVETYSTVQSVRVITRYYNDYLWHPWHDYTYWYFYTGPVYHFSDFYYVRYIYPHYRAHYMDIRRQCNDYLRVYYVERPHRHVRWMDVVRAPRGSAKVWERDRLNRWTPAYEEARKSYEIVSMKTRSTESEVRESRDRIRSVLATNSRTSPSAARVRSEESTQARGSGVTEMKQRRDSSGALNTRIRTEGSQDYERAPARVETRESVKTRREEVKKSSPPEPREREVKQTPPRGTSRERKVTPPPDNKQMKERREVNRSQKSEESRSIKRAPREEKSPPKEVEVKKKDNNKDDEDKDKKKEEEKSKSEESSVKKVRRGK